MTDLAPLFIEPQCRRHKYYEVLRAAFVDQIPLREIAQRFGFSHGTVRNLCSAFRQNPDLSAFFIPDAPPPKPETQTPLSTEFRNTRDTRILELRNHDGLSVTEIYHILKSEGIQSSPSNIGLILRKAGVKKLRRRTHQQRMDTVTVIKSPAADHRKLDLSPVSFTTDFGGIFLFAADLARMKIDQLLEASQMPGSRKIPAGCAIRALLALKLWGVRRNSHVMADPGLALFAGLNTMPKRSTLTEYSCRVHPEYIRHLMELWHPAARSLGVTLGSEDSFDLDFHTIPYHGDDALTEKHYISKRSRSQKGILSLVVRDAEARLFVYANAKIRRSDREKQIPEFVDFWRNQTGQLPRELVFDSTFTTYSQLQSLTELGIHFLTIRRRSKKLVKALLNTPSDQWRKIRLTNVGRAYRNPRILDSKIQLRGYQGPLRQMAIMDLGHDQPTLLITNQMETAPSTLIDRYARRMIIENTIADAIDFFHLDALSSSVPLKIEVDLQLTLMASTLYRILARRIGQGIENEKPRTIFRKFVRNRANIEISKHEIVVTLTRRANNPYLLSANYNNLTQSIPWLNNKTMRIQFQ